MLRKRPRRWRASKRPCLSLQSRVGRRNKTGAEAVQGRAMVQTAQMPHAVGQQTQAVHCGLLAVEQTFPPQGVQRKQQRARQAGVAGKGQHIGRPHAAEKAPVGRADARVVQNVQVNAARREHCAAVSLRSMAVSTRVSTR